MIFKRPPNVRIVDMCIYIDEHVYEESFNEQIIYEYLYHIFKSMALNKKLFRKHENIDTFSLYAATRVYLRLTNKKQFQYDENGNPKLKKVKSVANLIRSILYPLKVDFEQSEYYQYIKIDDTEDFISYSFNNLLYKSIDPINKCIFGMVLNDIDKIIKDFLNEIVPYEKSSALFLNIYISVLITLCRQFQLSQKVSQYLKYLDKKNKLSSKHLEEAFHNLENTSISLFHLDNSMHQYILILTRQVKHKLGKELTECLQSNAEQDLQLMDLITLSYRREVEENDIERKI